jgi:hypothetical protein
MDLVSLLVIVIVFGVLFWLLQTIIPIAQPMKNIALAILGIIFILYLLDGVHLGHIRYLR